MPESVDGNAISQTMGSGFQKDIKSDAFLSLLDSRAEFTNGTSSS